jgi:hypothetical protein
MSSSLRKDALSKGSETYHKKTSSQQQGKQPGTRIAASNKESNQEQG